MPEERRVVLDLGDGVQMVVLAEPTGPQLVADDEVVAKLESVTGPIERVGKSVLQAAKNAMPTKASVELGFSLAIEQGHLVALFGKGRGEATIKVTLEWSADAGGTGTGAT
jgi:hypothetical protein